MADAALLFAWQQHPETRRYARNPEPPKWHTHVFWLGNLQRESMRELFIALDAEEHPVGSIRLDYEMYTAEVSIIVAPGLRNMGVGTEMLKALFAKMPGQNLKAFILPENTASIRLFSKWFGQSDPASGWWQRPHHIDQRLSA